MMDFAVSGVRCGRISTAPMSTPRFAPIGLKACARLSLRVEVASSPIAITKGFAEVSRMDSPAARVNNASRNMA